MGQGSVLSFEKRLAWSELPIKERSTQGFCISYCRCGTKGKREGWGLKDVSSPTSKYGVRLFIMWRQPTFISCSCYLSITVRVGALVHDIFRLSEQQLSGTLPITLANKRKKKEEEERKNSPSHTKLYSFCPEVSCVIVLIFHRPNWVTWLCQMQRVRRVQSTICLEGGEPKIFDEPLCCLPQVDLEGWAEYWQVTKEYCWNSRNKMSRDVEGWVVWLNQRMSEMNIWEMRLERRVEFCNRKVLKMKYFGLRAWDGMNNFESSEHVLLSKMA